MMDYYPNEFLAEVLLVGEHCPIRSPCVSY